MPTPILPVVPDRPDPKLVQRAAEEILRGGVVAFLTDTQYGLSCSLLDPAAVRFMYRMKGRPPGLSVISLIAEPSDAETLALDVPPPARRLIRDHWPGPLTIIFRASPLVPAESRGERDTIALRCPNHQLSRALVEAIGGPVVSTSANRSGSPPARTAQEVADLFGSQLSLILDGGEATATAPSTIVDVTETPPVLVREGVLDLSGWLDNERKRVRPDASPPAALS